MGYAASALVLAAFCMRDMIALRIVSLFSNLAFIAYGVALDLTPIWLLHGLLLPMNLWRLMQNVGARPQPPRSTHRRLRRSRLAGADAWADVGFNRGRAASWPQFGPSKGERGGACELR
jgi:hypothetical protein